MTKKLIVIGGVAGGATAAARARRLDENAEIILFERGEHISFANCGLPYYIGNVIQSRDALLVATPSLLKERYNIDVRIFSEVVAIDRREKTVQVKNHPTGKTYTEGYDKIILSPGAMPLKPPLPGIDSENIFNLRNIPDTDRIKTFVDTRRPETAVVVGGGFIGLEMAENLSLRGIKTIVVEMLDQVMAPVDYEMAAILHAHLREKGVGCMLKNGVTAFEQNRDKIVVHLKKGTPIKSDMVVLSVGIRPENQLAADAGLSISQRGGIIVDQTLRTSDPDILAVGDAVEIRDYITGIPVMTPLAGPANKQGRIAADNAMGRRSVFKGTLGTSVAKVFDMTVACTGANEKILKQHHIPYLTSYTHSESHASYYPGAAMMAIKLIFSPSSGKILGSQIVGADGVDKRIDVLATAIRGGLTVYDLEELELAYAPPYGSAKDPVNIAGFVASNILKGDVENTYWNDLADFDPSCDILIDLRNREELDESGKIEDALHIPLDKLRATIPDLDKSKNYIVYCAIGLRGYIGYRILVQNGFRVKNLSGGYKTYLGAREKLMKESEKTRKWLTG